MLLAIGTRLQDFTTGSRALLPGKARLIQLNIAAFDAGKHGAVPLVGDAKRTLEDHRRGARFPHARRRPGARRRSRWARSGTAPSTARPRATNADLPSDAQVLGAVNRKAGPKDIMVCAAGGLPGELHKLWRTGTPGGYHLEYGYSCMGYEIAGGLGVKMAHPDREVFVLVGDGSYLMMNSEIATSVMLGRKLTLVVLDNSGFGCINRLQRATGGESFNNLFEHVDHKEGAADGGFRRPCQQPRRRYRRKSRASPIWNRRWSGRGPRRRPMSSSSTPTRWSTTQDGGAWWDVAVPEISVRPQVRKAHEEYVAADDTAEAGLTAQDPA